MRYNKYANMILDEIQKSVLSVNENEVENVVRLLTKHKRVFCDAKGRTGLQLAAFAMRLAQIGYNAYVVWETTTPAIKHGDLLLVCSGSGNAPELLSHTQKALSLGASTIAVTANSDSKLIDGSSGKIIINAPQKQENSAASMQPMGTLFEQALSVILDSIVLAMMETLHMTGEELFMNHRNLE